MSRSHDSSVCRSESRDDHELPRPPAPPLAHPFLDARELRRLRREEVRWWIKLFVQPTLLFIFGAMLIIGLGIGQQAGFLQTASVESSNQGSSAAITYICPMMCAEPQTEQGRCPVCAMELVPATSSGTNEGSNALEIGTAARRIANIQTTKVRSEHCTRQIKAVGKIAYDETRMKTIAAYVDGRIEELHVAYTGATVDEGDELALVYSPELYSSQVEFLTAFEGLNSSGTDERDPLEEVSKRLYESSRQRLSEFGMTSQQLEELELVGEARSRMQILAPMGGTVVDKQVVDGQFVTEGETLFQLVDLSTIWLQLELLPEDVVSISYGQRVEAEVQSLPGQTFVGRVAFVEPEVDPLTRTVGVRVIMPNRRGELRIGEFARASISVPISRPDHESSAFYDEELAGRWICPVHPQVISNGKGNCEHCEAGLVATTAFGFAENDSRSASTLLVPRDAVLMIGKRSVVYVETEPGRFELREVVLGPTVGDDIAIFEGVMAGEQVASRGNFLIDSQMQLAGNPSLIDPTKALPLEEVDPEVLAAMAELSDEDRQLAEAQGDCPVADKPLGSMGVPIKVDVNGVPIFICCAGCRRLLLSEPLAYIEKVRAWSPLLASFPAKEGSDAEAQETRISINLDQHARPPAPAPVSPFDSGTSTDDLVGDHSTHAAAAIDLFAPMLDVTAPTPPLGNPKDVAARPEGEREKIR